ncbi:MAG: transcriptional regulator, partial [Bdellovibrionota bacterium]
LSDALDEPEYKLSRHVKILKSVGLLKSVRDGKWIYHSLVKNHNYLKAILKAIAMFPDPDNLTQTDFARFRKRVVKRSNGRCTVPARVLEVTEKRA